MDSDASQREAVKHEATVHNFKVLATRTVAIGEVWKSKSPGETPPLKPRDSASTVVAQGILAFVCE